MLLQVNFSQGFATKEAGTTNLDRMKAYLGTVVRGTKAQIKKSQRFAGG
jgi:hypothetical protein